MARVEVERLAIGGGGLGLMTDGVAHQTEEVEHLR